MTKSGLIKRLFIQETDKLKGIKIELAAKGISVDDYKISLDEKHIELSEAILLAIENFDTLKQEEILEEAKEFCSQTRKAIELLTLEHLKKGYK
jgi:hypothetical protein